MSKVIRLAALALFGIIAVAMSMPASGWLGPNFCYGPGDVLPAAMPAPYGTLGSGFFETESYTIGTGAATASDAFTNSVISPGAWPFGGSFWSPCGFGAGGCGGLAQTGLGSNFGAQNSATGTYTRSTAFGLAPSKVVGFGIPIPGPGGFIYC